MLNVYLFKIVQKLLKHNVRFTQNFDNNKITYKVYYLKRATMEKYQIIKNIFR